MIRLQVTPCDKHAACWQARLLADGWSLVAHGESTAKAVETVVTIKRLARRRKWEAWSM